jgi:hypothetical protein
MDSEMRRKDEEVQRKIEMQRQAREKAAREMADVLMGKPTSIPRKPVDKDKIAEYERAKAEAIAELNSQFAIPETYRNKYADFLKQKNTGIAKMFPDSNCDVGLTVAVEELERCHKSPQVKGSGSRYSIKFNWLPDYISVEQIRNLFKDADIYYNGNSLLFGNENTQSIVSEIGEVNFEEVTLEAPVGKFLTKFKPSRTKTEFQQQTKILQKGINDNGLLYANFSAVNLNSVYIFRSITFSESNPPNRFAFWNRDLLVGFKIVGRGDDGSIIFIWKKLKEKTAPYLENK